MDKKLLDLIISRQAITKKQRCIDLGALRRECLHMGYSAKEVCHYCNVDERTMRRLEHGRASNVDTYDKLLGGMMMIIEYHTKIN